MNSSSGIKLQTSSTAGEYQIQANRQQSPETIMTPSPTAQVKEIKMCPAVAKLGRFRSDAEFVKYVLRNECMHHAGIGLLIAGAISILASGGCFCALPSIATKVKQLLAGGEIEQANRALEEGDRIAYAAYALLGIAAAGILTGGILSCVARWGCQTKKENTITA